MRVIARPGSKHPGCPVAFECTPLQVSNGVHRRAFDLVWAAGYGNDRHGFKLGCARTTLVEAPLSLRRMKAWSLVALGDP